MLRLILTNLTSIIPMTVYGVIVSLNSTVGIAFGLMHVFYWMLLVINHEKATRI